MPTKRKTSYTPKELEKTIEYTSISTGVFALSMLIAGIIDCYSLQTVMITFSILTLISLVTSISLSIYANYDKE